MGIDGLSVTVTTRPPNPALKPTRVPLRSSERLNASVRQDTTETGTNEPGLGIHVDWDWVKQHTTQIQD